MQRILESILQVSIDIVLYNASFPDGLQCSVLVGDTFIGDGGK